ncbi:MAG TPA: hypothetical protein VEQ16_08585 [Acidocella sp.]|jgi:hypothetical protein|nr:hypothetical protein [Acidocella sp.]
MSDTAASRAKNSVHVVYGQYHKFKLIPIMEHHAQFLRAGPVTFGIEGRVLGAPQGVVGEIGVSLHVFNADRSEEWLRFDCFDRGPHYYYVLYHLGHNIVWGYDPAANGPMRPWALNAVRTRLPAMLRKSGAAALAAAVEREGIDDAVLDEVEAAMIEADRCIRPGSLKMIEEGIAWMARWKRLHPQFNTVDDD